MALANDRNNFLDFTSNFQEQSDHKKYSEPDMASNLFWRPICDNDSPLDKHLKWILKEEELTDNPLSVKDLGFLRGLRAAGIKDADKLMEAIEKYGYIELYEV